MNIYLDSTLEHAGVKGMKWGVRKAVDTVKFTGKAAKAIGRAAKRYENNYANEKYNKYREEGYGHKEASKLTNRRVNTNRALIGAAAVTAIGVGAYAGKRAWDFNVKDTVLKKGDTIQTVLSTGKVDMSRPVYGVQKGTRDAKMYKGFIKAHLGMRGVDSDSVFNNTIRVNKDIKIASRNTAKKVFDDLYKNDKEFVKGLGRDYFGDVRGKYDNFNTLIPMGKTKSYDKVVSVLKKKGYSGMVDVNDYKRSFANKPMIMFEGTKDITQIGAKPITGTSVNKDYYSILGQRAGIHTAGLAANYTLGYKAISALKRKAKSKIKGSEYDRITGRRIVR